MKSRKMVESLFVPFVTTGVVALALTACKKDDAPPHASTAAATTAPTQEVPPTVTLPARTDVSTTAEEMKTVVVLEGTFGAKNERGRLADERDRGACTDPVALDRAIRVVDAKGNLLKDERGTGAHAAIGDAKRVCIWAWKGYEAGGKTWIPWGSHVVIRGTLTGPMRPQHPTAVLMFDAEVLSASPAQASAPADAFPDGDSVVFVKTRGHSNRRARSRLPLLRRRREEDRRVAEDAAAGRTPLVHRQRQSAASLARARAPAFR